MPVLVTVWRGDRNTEWGLSNTMKALRLDGFTSVYLQYTGARINSLLTKAKIKIKPKTIKFDLLVEGKEKMLALAVARFPEVVKEAGGANDPSVVAKYLFDVSRLFNDYYHSSQIIQDNKNLQAARLALASGVLVVLERGLGLLGIETPEKM